MDIDLEREAGRTVRVRCAGASEGPLIVYLHGSPSSRLDVDDSDERSRARGVRLAAIDRPGYGGSTYAPYGFSTVAADVCAVADHLEVDTFAVIGQSAGAPHALATAALFPGRVTAVATGGGPAPFRPESPWWADLSEGEQEGVRLLGIDDDRANELLAQADLPHMNALALDDDGLLAYWSDLCGPADRRYLDARLGPQFVATVRESLRQGQAGWARDNVVRMGAWAFELADIRCQTTLWYGDEDHWQPGEWVAARVPQAALRVLPDRGHLVMFEEWDQVLDDFGFARNG